MNDKYADEYWAGYNTYYGDGYDPRLGINPDSMNNPYANMEDKIDQYYWWAKGFVTAKNERYNGEIYSGE